MVSPERIGPLRALDLIGREAVRHDSSSGYFEEAPQKSDKIRHAELIKDDAKFLAGVLTANSLVLQHGGDPEEND